MSSPKVTYSYADGSANTIRPTSVTYPDNTGGTRVLTYDYGTSGGMNDKLSRVESQGFGGTSNLVQPSYLGLGTQVRTDYTQPQVRWDLATGSSPNPYAGLDRFGRVIDNKWSNSSTSATLDQIEYTYDRASNRTTRENTVAKAQATPQYFDELYGYDGSNRLTQMQRGQLAGTTSITNLQFAQDWGLDPTGNWQQFNEDSDGSGTNDLVQARTANPVNEITDITNGVGAPWVQPGYDAAGNMTTIPQGNEPEEGFTGVYDAWNRLVKLIDEDDNVVAEYAYDGLTRRIRKTTAAETRHYLYNASWQILEERVGSATTYDRQYVWGLRYIDDCVLRDKSGGARLYALQDANWNVDALVDTSASVVERFSYSAYGVPAFLNPDFTEKAGSDYAWDVLYAGYKWDGESGMYQVRFRYLQPVTGKWISRDPLGYKRNVTNLQLYVNSNPIISIDFMGLIAHTVHTVIKSWDYDGIWSADDVLGISHFFFTTECDANCDAQVINPLKSVARTYNAMWGSAYFTGAITNNVINCPNGKLGQKVVIILDVNTNAGIAGGIYATIVGVAAGIAAGAPANLSGIMWGVGAMGVTAGLHNWLVSDSSKMVVIYEICCCCNNIPVEPEIQATATGIGSEMYSEVWVQTMDCWATKGILRNGWWRFGGYGDDYNTTHWWR